MNYLGIEIGGTKLQIGLGPGDGTLAGLWRGPVDVAAGPEEIRRQITTVVPDLLAKVGISRSQIGGIGIGFGGPVDDATHTVIKSHQIEGWENYPLADWIAEILGWQAVLGNDADVAGLAEALFGAGQGLSPIFYITIGSGIGGGFIVNGEVYRGCGRGAAEIGHVRVGVKAYPEAGGIKSERKGISPGDQSCLLEEIASGWAIGKRVRVEAAGRNDSDSALFRQVNGQWDRLTAVHVGQAAAQGDPLAWSLLYPAWHCLAQAMAHVLVLLCPRRFVIGGGVSLMGEDVLFKPLSAFVAVLAFEPFADCYDIVPAALGEEVVVHGALALARRQFRDSCP